MNREKYWEITKKDWLQTAFLLLMFITTLGLFSILLLPDYWYFWILIIAVELLLIVSWHAKNFSYRCPKCDQVFEISTIQDVISPNGVNKKYLKCPKCRKRAWAEVLRIK
jgi:uncharacterized C2H2 Zn-finger protein